HPSPHLLVIPTAPSFSLFPYTTLFRSQAADRQFLTGAQHGDMSTSGHRVDLRDQVHIRQSASAQSDKARRIESFFDVLQSIRDRSEERRVGKECRAVWGA